MINKETILSYANDNLTLLEWLKKTEQALENGVVTNFEWVTETNTSGHLKLTFSDKTLLETNTITLPKGETGEKGDKGDKGDKGENYLIYNKSYDGDMIPNSTLLYNLQLTDFNRIPQVYDDCIVLYNYYKDMVLIDTYLTIATITQVTNTEAFGTTKSAIKTTGKQGIQGVQGEQGVQGVQGENGVTPNIQIGTVTTLDAGSMAIASITGTTENPLLNLGIPKGQSGVDINARYKHIIQMEINNNRPLYLNCDIINENSTPFDFSTFYDYIISMVDNTIVKCNFNGFIVGSAATSSGTVLRLENTGPENDVMAVGVSYKMGISENFNKNSTVVYFRDLVIPL